MNAKEAPQAEERKALNQAYADAMKFLFHSSLSALWFYAASLHPSEALGSEMLRGAGYLGAAAGAFYAASACLAYHGYMKMIRCAYEENEESADERLDREVARRLKEMGARGIYNLE